MQPAPWHRPGTADGLSPVLLGWVGGNALQLTQPALWPWWSYAALVLAGAGAALAALLAPYAASRRLRQGAWLLAAAMLAYGQVGLRAVAYGADALESVLEGRDLLVTGVVATMPQRGGSGLRFQLQVESARMGGAVVAVPARIQLGWYGAVRDPVGAGPAQAGDGVPPLRAGERWRLPVRLKAPHGNSNPHGFDYELWLWQHGVAATGYVRDAAGPAAPLRLGQTGRYPVEWLRQRVRERIDARLAPSPQAGWITALVTGDQNAIDRADWDVFRATGVAHLMSISGLHVTMFAWLAAALTAALWRRSQRLCLWLPAPQAALLGGPLLALAYAVFSGWGVPSQRTVAMLLVVCLLRLCGRRWPWPMVWLLAGVAVLLLDPWALMQAGFWLSFVAVGVLFASGDSDRPLPASAAQRLRGLVREQAVITLALTPLVVLLFGQVSLVGFAANLVAIPWITLLVTPLAMMGTVFSPAWDLAALAVELLAQGLGWLARLPASSVTVPAAPRAIAIAAVCGGACIALRLPLPLRLAGVALVVPVLLWQPARPPYGQFDLLAADVGQGNAVLVRTAHHVLLYDAGPRYGRDSDAGHRVLVPLLRALGATPDLLVLSHGDSDHVGGAAAVLAMAPRAGLLASLAPDHALWGLRAGRRCEAGQRWTWDGVEFAVLHPQPSDDLNRLKPNALSCVLRIRAAAIAAQPLAPAALLAGDIESAQEQRLVAQAADLRADLLLVPHHGSRTSSSAAFLDAVAPRVALVQSGYRNRFGHPAAEPMARYAQRSVQVVDSPACGAMAWQSRHPAVVSCHRVQQARYWNHRLPARSRLQ